MTERAEHSGGWAGLAYLAVVLVAAFLPGIPPAPDASAAVVAAFVAAHHMQWMIAGWLIFPGTAFFLWWLVQLAQTLRDAGDRDSLGAYATVGGVATSVIVLLTSFSQLLMGLRPDASPAVLQLLFDCFNGFGGLVFMPATILIVAVSRGAQQNGAFSKAVMIFGYVAAVGCAISTLSLFSLHGFLAAGGVGTALFGLLPFGVWGTWISIEMIRKPRRGQAAA